MFRLKEAGRKIMGHVTSALRQPPTRLPDGGRREAEESKPEDDAGVKALNAMLNQLVGESNPDSAPNSNSGANTEESNPEDDAGVKALNAMLNGLVGGSNPDSALDTDNSAKETGLGDGSQALADALIQTQEKGGWKKSVKKYGPFATGVLSAAISFLATASNPALAGEISSLSRISMISTLLLGESGATLAFGIAMNIDKITEKITGKEQNHRKAVQWIGRFSQSKAAAALPWLVAASAGAVVGSAGGALAAPYVHGPHISIAQPHIDTAQIGGHVNGFFHHLSERVSKLVHLPHHPSHPATPTSPPYTDHPTGTATPTQISHQPSHHPLSPVSSGESNQPTMTTTPAADQSHQPYLNGHGLGPDHSATGQSHQGVTPPHHGVTQGETQPTKTGHHDYLGGHGLKSDHLADNGTQHMGNSTPNIDGHKLINEGMVNQHLTALNGGQIHIVSNGSGIDQIFYKQPGSAVWEHWRLGHWLVEQHPKLLQASGLTPKQAIQTLNTAQIAWARNPDLLHNHSALYQTFHYLNKTLNGNGGLVVKNISARTLQEAAKQATQVLASMGN